MSAASQSPVNCGIGYPEGLIRWHLILKVFLGWLYVGIPHGFILSVYGILSLFATIVGFFAILISGNMPLGIFNFVVGYQRWSIRVSSYYIYLMVDSYPPFTNAGGSHPADLSVAYPESVSRKLALLKVLLGWLYVGIPHGIALFIYGIAVTVAVFISAWSVLLFGRYPRTLFDFNLGFLRWSARVDAYLTLLRDEYPPFHGRA